MDTSGSAFTRHAAERASALWPDKDWLAILAAGELMDPELVRALTQRKQARTGQVQRDRYVLSPDQRGIFVVSPDDRVITVLRLGEQQRRILAPVEARVEPPSPKAPPRPVVHGKPIPPEHPRADEYVLLEFFPDGSFTREMVVPESAVTCAVCQEVIQPWTWTLRVRVWVEREPPFPKTRRFRRVCLACLDARLALFAVPS